MDFIADYFKPDLREQIRAHQRGLRQDKRDIEREIREMKRDEKKILAELRKTARKDDKEGLKRLAALVVKSRRKQQTMVNMIEHINNVQIELKIVHAQLRNQKIIENTAKLMEHMNNLVSYDKVQKRAYQMNEEFVKAGLVNEMIQETVDATAEVDSLVAEDEIERIVEEALYGPESVETKQHTEVLPTAPLNPVVAVVSEESDEELNPVAA
eukprot:maker-scaffold_14-snap-gene-1.0-mRNA-1 protein AED:0.05 eAED:0.05 QI:75/1/1/1/0.66/0.5/4/183/211